MGSSPPPMASKPSHSRLRAKELAHLSSPSPTRPPLFSLSYNPAPPVILPLPPFSFSARPSPPSSSLRPTFLLSRPTAQPSLSFLSLRGPSPFLPFRAAHPPPQPSQRRALSLLQSLTAWARMSRDSSAPLRRRAAPRLLGLERMPRPPSPFISAANPLGLEPLTLDAASNRRRHQSIASPPLCSHELVQELRRPKPSPSRSPAPARARRSFRSAAVRRQPPPPRNPRVEPPKRDETRREKELPSPQPSQLRRGHGLAPPRSGDLCPQAPRAPLAAAVPVLQKSPSIVDEPFEFADDPVLEEQLQQQFSEEGKYNTDHPCYLYTD
nr:unnamed protein product [Digitaria exilis]